MAPIPGICTLDLDSEAKMTTFKDHFSGHAASYAAYRPGYPPALFSFVAGLPRNLQLAWDCGTGNGQATVGLAEHFRRVVATDASAAQIANAVPHPGVDYRIAAAESSGLAPGSVDLIAVGQAFHWFDFDRFYAEARRVLAPGGAVAVWTYNLARVSPEIDAATDGFAYRTVVAHWPPERRWVDEEYRTIPFPFAEVETPRLHHEECWDLPRFLAYLRTWSSVQRYAKETGRDPVSLVYDELAALWGEPATVRTIHWPIFLRAGRGEA